MIVANPHWRLIVNRLDAIQTRPEHQVLPVYILIVYEGEYQ
ncbi:MAG: hypothetical protein ACI9W6_002460 [Motiliproteus sp.]|jgi:hypothetical protein